jgi:hypothetical protein
MSEVCATLRRLSFTAMGFHNTRFFSGAAGCNLSG